MKTRLTLFTLLTIALVSCTVQKSQKSTVFYVDWYKQTKSALVISEPDKAVSLQTGPIQYNTEELFAHGDVIWKVAMSEALAKDKALIDGPEEPKKIDPVQEIPDRVEPSQSEPIQPIKEVSLHEELTMTSPQEPVKQDYNQESKGKIKPIEADKIEPTDRTRNSSATNSSRHPSAQVKLPDEKALSDLSGNADTLLTRKEKKKKKGDGLIYLITTLMGLTSLGFLTRRRSKLLKLTRWAKAKPKKAQGLIAGIQLLLMGLGILGGHNLREMGYVLSDGSMFAFGAIALLGFLSVPFLPKRGTVAIPKRVNRLRLGFLGTAIASLMMMTGIGNSLVNKYPDTFLANAVEAVDQSIFPTGSDEPTGSIEAGAVQTNNQMLRGVLGAGICALAILLIILMVATTCAGVCLIIGGLAGGSVGWALLGLLISFLSIWGIISVAKWCKKE